MNEHSAYRVWVKRLAHRGRLDEATVSALLALPTRSVRIGRHRDWRMKEEPLTEVHIVVAGVAGCFRQSADGRRHISSIYLPGDACDVQGIVLPSLEANWTALDELQLAAVSHSSLRTLARSSPTLAEALWQEGAIEYQILKHYAYVNGTRPGEERLAHLVCELSERYAQLGHPNDRFPASLTQADIGEMIDLTAVHVNRVFRVLREKCLVTAKKHGDVVIHDRGRLARLCGFTPGYLRLPVGDV